MKERIVLGIGNNIDYEVVWSSQVLERLIVQHSIHDEELLPGKAVCSERDLVVSILGFLKYGSGGECFVASVEILEAFARNFESRITLGGTSVRAAAAMRKLGYTSALHLVSINDHVRELLPPDCPYVCSAVEEKVYPHLIIQFCKGARVKALDIDLCASRSNRIIYVNDRDNTILALSGDLAGLVSEAKVFLVSGFNAMQSRALLAGRLSTLLQILEKLPTDAYIVYEDACFHDASLSRQVRDALMERVSVYSLNEDELQGYLQRTLDLLDPLHMKEALADIHRMIPVPALVVHTQYWALAYGENAGFFSKALRGGIIMAGTRFRVGDDFTVADYEETERSPLQQEGAAFAGELSRLLGDAVCCLPCIQAEEANATTVGLGDAFVGGFLPALLP